MDWRTGRWSLDGQLMPQGTMPPRGEYGHAVNGTFNSHAVHAESAGSVLVRVKFVGQGAPPQLVDVVLPAHSEAGWSAGYGDADNGVGGERTFEWSGSAGRMRHSARKIRTFPVSVVSGEASFTYNSYATSSATGIGSNCGAYSLWLGANSTMRRVSLQSTSHPGNYVRFLTGESASEIIPDWYSTTTATYQLTRSIPVEVEYTPRGSSWSSRVAIPYLYWNVEQSGVTVPFSATNSLVSWQGHVTGIDVGSYHYSGPTGSFGGGLPTGLFGDNYTVPPYQYYIYNALQVEDVQFGTGPRTTFYPGNSDSGDAAKFSFRWQADGAAGEATADVEYSLPYVRGAAFGEHTEQPEPDTIAYGPEPFARYGTFQLMLGPDNGWVSNHEDVGELHWQSVHAGWKVSNNAKGFAKWVKPAVPFIFSEKHKAAATYLDFVADLPGLFEVQEHTTSRQSNLFLKACRLQNVKPAPPSADPAYMSAYHWREMRRQLYAISLFADDVYNQTGYVGQQLGRHFSPTSGYDRRQVFENFFLGGPS